ncbi:tetratricopeptide repeat protein [Kingella potus]|nr:tetratricopeptide repeat protein [Kingella potus]UOP01817.1 tetratricopeptide repeat protein [Kingella potus]
MRDMVRGNYANARDGFDAALAGADESQRSRIFLLVAQIAAQNPEVAKIMEDTVHKHAAAHQDKPDAVIADAILSALNDKPDAAVRALQRLAQLDSEILPPTYITMRLIGQRKPDTINRFFAETDTEKLSPVWQELQIEALIYAGKKEEAGRLLQHLIDKRPSADLYIQAALLSSNRKAPLEETVGYLTKAYQTGTQEQQSRAAVIAVLRNADNKNFAAARKWVAKIHAADYAFDKAVLTASLDAEEHKWQQAAAEVRRARKMTAKQGRFFDTTHLDRIETLTAARLPAPQQALAALNRLYERAVRQKADAETLATILYQRALVYSDRLHQPEKAVADLRRCLELVPGNPNTQNALGYTLITLSKPQINEGFVLISAAFEQMPEDPAVNDSMGWAYFLKGDAEAALPYLQYAFKEQPEAEVAAHLGEVLWTLGRKDEASAILKQGQSIDSGHRVLQNTLHRLGLTPAKPAAETAKGKGKAEPVQQAAKKKKAV